MVPAAVDASPSGTCSPKECKARRKAGTSSRSVSSETRHQLPNCGNAEGSRRSERPGGTGDATGEAEGEDFVEKATSGARASRGAQARGGKRTWRRRTRRGARRRRRPTTNSVARIGPRKKASKSIRDCVAAGQPVSAGGKRAGRHGLTTSRARLRVGTKPLNGNPGRGCGMKEARAVEGGESRREVAKT